MIVVRQTTITILLDKSVITSTRPNAIHLDDAQVSFLFVSGCRQEQMKSENKTGTSKVGAISKAQKDRSYASSSAKRKVLRI